MIKQRKNRVSWTVLDTTAKSTPKSENSFWYNIRSYFFP